METNHTHVPDAGDWWMDAYGHTVRVLHVGTDDGRGHWCLVEVVSGKIIKVLITPDWIYQGWDRLTTAQAEVGRNYASKQTYDMLQEFSRIVYIEGERWTGR